MKKNYLYQPYYLVSSSPWPILMSLNILILLVGVVYWLNFFSLNLIFLGVVLLILNLFQWWRDLVREGLFQGFHVKEIMSNMKFGMFLFIISEIFFFISIFWCYFHMFLSPSVEIGSNWPPMNIEIFNPYMVPLLNTIILLSSGVSITWCHYSLLFSNKLDSVISLSITLMLGLVFSLFQVMEYLEASFSFSDSVFGSIFFMSTGFHGFHVVIGSIFLKVNLIRLIFNNFSMTHHLGFEFSAWYWHFVDVVWLFLYLLVYILPN